MSKTVNLTDLFLATLDEGEHSFSVTPTDKCKNIMCVDETDIFPNVSELCLNVTREMLISAPKNDPSLSVCFSSVVADGEDRKSCSYFLDNDVLMRRWSPDSANLCSIYQVVGPKDYRVQILSLAHDSSLRGKPIITFCAIFFCPGLKADVTRYCHVKLWESPIKLFP